MLALGRVRGRPIPAAGCDENGEGVVRLRCEVPGAPVRAAATDFPFSAVGGMEELKLALALNAVSPGIGGGGGRGGKGKAKAAVGRAVARPAAELGGGGGCRFPPHPH